MQDVDDLFHQFEAIKQKHAKAVAEFAEDDRYTSGTFATDTVPEKWTDEGLESTVLPSAYDAVENAVDHILTRPRITVPVRPVTKNRETERQIAENKRYFLQYCWDTFTVREGNPIRRLAKSLIKGKGILKLEVDWDNIPDASLSTAKYRKQLEKSSRSNFPIRLTVVPKETVFEDWTQPWDARYVYEHYKAYIQDLLPKYGDNTMPDGTTVRARFASSSPTEEVEFLEYWSKPSGNDPGKYICWINGERVHEVDNPYGFETEYSTEGKPRYSGFHPYVIGDPGWGDTDAKGNPEDRYVSIIRPLRSLYKAETRQITEVEAWLRLYLWKPVIGTNLPKVAEGEDDPYVLGPGAFWNVNKDAGQSIDVLQFGEAPTTAFQFLGRIQQAADRSSKFGALGGTAQQGVSTATESDQLIRNASTKLSGPIATLQRMVTMVNSMILMTAEKILESPISVTGATAYGPSVVTIKPSDIDGFYFTSVEMDTSDKSALEARNARLWGEMYRLYTGNLSARTALLKSGVDNVSEEGDEAAVEGMLRSPQIQQVELLLALTGMGAQAEEVTNAFRMSMMGGPGDQSGATGPVMGDAASMMNTNQGGELVTPPNVIAGGQLERQMQ